MNYSAQLVDLNEPSLPYTISRARQGGGNADIGETVGA